MTDWREHVREAAGQLESAGIENAYREAQQLWCAVSELSLADWLSGRGAVSPGLETSYALAILRRCAREPYHYIAGSREFMGLELLVDPRVLIPRPETEHLVERVLHDTPRRSQRIVDVGTGSGAVALALSHYGWAGWEIVGVDASVPALEVARMNAGRLAGGSAVQWLHSDLLQNVSGPLDVVAANLPYVDPSQGGSLALELQYEPPEALYAEDHGLAVIRRLIEECPGKMAAGGRIYLEVGQGQAETAEAVLWAHGFSVLPRERDLAGVDRVVAGAWTTKGGDFAHGR